MFGFFLMILGGAVAYLYWLSVRSRPADQRAIDIFAMQHGLRVISVTRSYNYFRYFIRRMGVDGLSSMTRFYEIAAEDSEGSRGDLHIAFDPLFGSGQLAVLDSEGLLLASPDELARLNQSDLARRAD